MAEKVFNFIYEYDFWDMVNAYDHFTKREAMKDIRRDLALFPEGLAEYIEQFDTEEAKALAMEIRKR